MSKKCNCPNCKEEIILGSEFSFGKRIIECKACGEKIHLKFGKIIKDYDKIETINPEEILVNDYEVSDTDYPFAEENTGEQPFVSEDEGIIPETEDISETDDVPETENISETEKTAESEPVHESEHKHDAFEKKKREKKKISFDSIKNMFSSDNPDSGLYAVKMQYRAWKNANRKIVWILRGIIALLVITVSLAVYINNLIPVGLDSRDLTDMNYKTVVKMLEDKGFTDVEAVPNEDLDMSEISKDNTVKYVEIGGDSDFEKNDHFLKGRNINVVYRTMRRVNLPLSSKELENRNYLDVAQLFAETGFTNIKCEPKRDLLVGLINKEGEVDEIIVNGKKKFNKKDRYRPDTEIIIKYHAFKEK
ncbi:MAG: hypothetical protein MJ081_07160 [Ruminococcus sp.]|nr:hypothetical protein [Ruminococcus sp.]